MDLLKKLAEERADLLESSRAILDNEESTEEEVRSADKMLDRIAEIDEEVKAEEKRQLEAINTKEKIEARRARLDEFESRNQITAPPEPNRTERRTQRWTVPAEARSWLPLKAFPRTEEGERDAYVSGQWTLATVMGNQRAQQWCAEHVPEYRALAENVNSTGGFLVPQEMARSVIRLVEEYGVFRSNTRVVPMASDTRDEPIRSTGLTGYWLTDNATITASNQTYTNVKLVAKKLGTLTQYSSELAQDSVVSIGDQIAMEVATCFANEEDDAGFNGTGATTFGNIVGLISAVGSAGVVTAPTGDIAFSDLILDTFESMVGKLPRYPGIQPRWFISQEGFWASMARLQDAAGGNTIATLADGANYRFMGFPVTIVNVMNSTLTDQASTNGLCYFGDLRMAACMGDRQQIRLFQSEHRYMELDQIAIRATERIDIKVHSAGDSTNPGAVIMLATPAS